MNENSNTQIHDNHILIITATEKEAAPLMSISEKQSETHSESGRIIISAQYKNQQFKILITGPCTINTAHALTCELERSRPAIVIQMGIAGIFKKTKLRIGDIALAESERYIHTGIETDQPYPDIDPLPFNLIDGNCLTVQGVFPVHSKLTTLSFQIIKKHPAMEKITISKGPFITVSTITSSSHTAKKLSNMFSPCMEAMEGSAAAHITQLYNIPFIEIRAGSNYVGERDKSKWDIPLSTKSVSRAVAVLIEHAEVLISSLKKTARSGE